MKFSAVVLASAGVATASYNHPRHFHHWRRDNTTASAGELTTLTVIATSIRTITSCAATVTNCPAANNTAALSTLPADQLTTPGDTDGDQLTTTVCPATAAASISSSVVAAHSSGLIPGKTITAETPLPTGVVVTPTDVTTEVPLTYTVGPSGQQSVVTTTLTSTIHSQVTVTLAKPSGGAGSANGEETTTSTLTSTGTRTVTIKGASSTGFSAATAEETGSGSGSGDCPAAVTVTLPAETVTVTVTAPTAAVTANNGQKAQAEPSTTASADDSEESECPPEDPTSSVVTAEVTATVVPYPAGNGTTAAPTGAARFRRFY